MLNALQLKIETQNNGEEVRGDTEKFNVVMVFFGNDVSRSW